jgi:hypothetical protein
VHVNQEREWINYEDLPMQAWDMVDFTEFEMDLGNYSNFKNHDIKNVVPSYQNAAAHSNVPSATCILCREES